ncbi:MerR family transcriptional regulator [Aggregatilinea lenta]|uniref:MerR family transcriptional regulator n=1 Tax=Aggregatilinea lenta TaxID=913108 RepID=UPI000E5AA8D5|nr:MerR family transcriptional regulator [Aggregatilinea lenta]
MLKIGDFSKLSRVSIKTLRYYDDMGLLKPSEVDRFTGYRYYGLDLLPRLNRILALKDLGLSLEQIASLLDEDLPADQLRGMLRLKRAELKQRVEEEQARLTRVEARLRQIEHEGKMPDYDVIVKRVDPVRVAAIRDEGNAETISAIAGRLFGEVAAFVERTNAGFGGPPMILYGYADECSEWQLEVAMPISRAVPGAGRVEVHELPAVEMMACTVHRGTFDTLPEAYRAMMGWIEANDTHICAESREVYLNFDMDDPARNVTELQFPIEKNGA